MANQVEDIDLLAKQLFQEQGVLPEQTYLTNYYDLMNAMKAREVKDRQIKVATKEELFAQLGI